MVINPFRERQALRWQEAERRKITQQQAKTSWASGLVALWKAVVTTALSLTTTTGVIIVAFLAIRSGLQHTISIEPLSTPKSMTDVGLTPAVTAHLLRDRINVMARSAKTRQPHREVIQKSDMPDIVVPAVGISLQALTTQFCGFLGFRKKLNITGEFTTESGLISLNLRLNGMKFFSSHAGVPQEWLGDLLADAAHASLQMTQPYIFAALVYDNDKPLALSTLESILASSSFSSREISVAHALKGNVLADLGRREEAVAEYKAAIALDPKISRSHSNLANVLADLGQREEALAEYKAAIALDPKDAYPHPGLGNVLADLGRRKEAIAEYKAAIALDPKYAYPHTGLSNVLTDLGRRDEAVSEYQAAIALDRGVSAPVSTRR